MLRFHILFGLIVLSLSQSSQSIAVFSSPYINAVCTSTTRYLNNEAFLTHMTSLQSQNQSAGNLYTQYRSCDNIKIDHTITSSGRSCKCPLVQKIVCVNNVPYANPCFAHCELPHTGYGNYKKCSDNVTNGISTTFYPYRQCPQCQSLAYDTVCIGRYHFSNTCFANCLQPNRPTARCTEAENALQATNPCVCLYLVSPVCIYGRRYINECIARCDFPNETLKLYKC